MILKFDNFDQAGIAGYVSAREIGVSTGTLNRLVARGLLKSAMVNTVMVYSKDQAGAILAERKRVPSGFVNMADLVEETGFKANNTALTHANKSGSIPSKLCSTGDDGLVRVFVDPVAYRTYAVNRKEAAARTAATSRMSLSVPATSLLDLQRQFDDMRREHVACCAKFDQLADLLMAEGFTDIAAKLRV